MKLLVIIIVITSFRICILGQSSKIEINGFVFDNKTNAKLPGVLLSVADSGVAITNQNGYFSFRIKKGNYYITAQMLGYTKQTKQIDLRNTDSKAKLFFRLTPEPIKIKQVTISGEKFTEDIKYKTYELQPGDLRNIPQFGEPDVFRAMLTLPGITSMNDFTTQLYVRGGNFDETLITLDNVPVYNPYHLGGIFGMFSSDIVGLQRLYPSNYPVEYGGYLSGVLNVFSKNTSVKKTRGSVSLGLITSRGFIETPFNKGTITLSVRRVYLDLISSLFTKDKLPYYFYDIFSKLSYPINKNNFISFEFFHSNDTYEVFKDRYFIKTCITDEPAWVNNFINFNFTHSFTSKNFIEAKFYISSSRTFGKGEAISTNNSKLKQLNVNNEIIDLTGQIKFNFALTGQKINSGIIYKNINLNYNWNISTNIFDFGTNLEDTFYDFADNPYNYHRNTKFLSAFISDNIQISKPLSITLGLREDYFYNLNSFLFSAYLKTKYKFSSNINLVFDYRNYYQPLYVIKDQNTLILEPFSVYFLQDSRDNLASSDNFSLGISFNNLYKNLHLEIEGYYKNRKNIASSYSDIGISNPYTFEKGYSAGLDLLLKKEKGTVNGWISYSLSRAIKSNKKYDYFARYDRTHSVKILANYNLSESWQLTSFWTFATGLPYTKMAGRYVFGEKPNFDDGYYYYDFRWDKIDGKKNQARTEFYHRLDIGINGSFIWGKYFVKPYLQILNVYNSPNPIYYNIKNNTNGKQTKRASYIVPTFGFTLEF